MLLAPNSASIVDALGTCSHFPEWPVSETRTGYHQRCRTPAKHARASLPKSYSHLAYTVQHLQDLLTLVKPPQGPDPSWSWWLGLPRTSRAWQRKAPSRLSTACSLRSLDLQLRSATNSSASPPQLSFYCSLQLKP